MNVIEKIKTGTMGHKTWSLCLAFCVAFIITLYSYYPIVEFTNSDNVSYWKIFLVFIFFLALLFSGLQCVDPIGGDENRLPINTLFMIIIFGLTIIYSILAIVEEFHPATLIFLLFFGFPLYALFDDKCKMD